MTPSGSFYHYTKAKDSILGTKTMWFTNIDEILDQEERKPVEDALRAFIADNIPKHRLINNRVLNTLPIRGTRGKYGCADTVSALFRHYDEGTFKEGKYWFQYLFCFSKTKSDALFERFEATGMIDFPPSFMKSFYKRVSRFPDIKCGDVSYDEAECKLKTEELLNAMLDDLEKKAEEKSDDLTIEDCMKCFGKYYTYLYEVFIFYKTDRFCVEDEFRVVIELSRNDRDWLLAGEKGKDLNGTLVPVFPGIPVSFENDAKHLVVDFSMLDWSEVI